MKLNEKALANALALVGAIYYIACYIIALIMPDVYKTIAQTWFHMLDLSSAWKDAPDGLVLGLVSFTAVSWVSGWLLASSYNKFLVKK